MPVRVLLKLRNDWWPHKLTMSGFDLLTPAHPDTVDGWAGTTATAHIMSPSKDEGPQMLTLSNQPRALAARPRNTVGECLGV